MICIQPALLAPRRREGLLALLALAGLAGCGTSRPPGAAGPAAATPAPPASAGGAAVLEAERQWLQSWFEGTPVSIQLRADGALAVEVPREFCFEPAALKPKAALAAVLDKVAESLRRRPQLRADLLAAPGDGTPPAAVLGAQRAQQLRSHLRSRGVAETRLAAGAAANTAAVQLRLRAG